MSNPIDPAGTQVAAVELWTAARGRDSVVCRSIVHQDADGIRSYEIRVSFNGSRFYSRVMSTGAAVISDADAMLADFLVRDWVLVGSNEPQCGH